VGAGQADRKGDPPAPRCVTVRHACRNPNFVMSAGFRSPWRDRRRNAQRSAHAAHGLAAGYTLRLEPPQLLQRVNSSGQVLLRILIPARFPASAAARSLQDPAERLPLVCLNPPLYNGLPSLGLPTPHHAVQLPRLRRLSSSGLPAQPLVSWQTPWCAGGLFALGLLKAPLCGPAPFIRRVLPFRATRNGPVSSEA
jgi:hypothetical protein